VQPIVDFLDGFWNATFAELDSILAKRQPPVA
jgi:hypothetical protein